MTDHPHILFGEDTGARTESSKLPQHWYTEFNSYLINNQLASREQLSQIEFEDITKEEELTDSAKGQLDNWRKPISGFGESTGADNKLGINKYLARTIYDEMYQIQKPNNEGINSTGGLITHIPPDAKISERDDKYTKMMINQSKRVRQELKNRLSSSISDTSKNNLLELGASISNLSDTESSFIETWNILKDKWSDVLESHDLEKISKYLKAIITVRCIPEFQFLFKSPFFWKNIELNKIG